MDSTVNQEKPYSIDSDDADNRTFIDISSSSSSSSSSDDSDNDDSFFADFLSEYDTERNLSEVDSSNFFLKEEKLERSGSSIALSPEFLSFLPSPLPLNFVAPENVTQAEPVTENALVAVDASVPSNINSQGKKRNVSEFGNSNFFLKKSKLEHSDSGIALSPEFPSFLPPPLPLNFVAPENETQAEPVSENALVAVDEAVPSNINSQVAPVLRTCGRQSWKAGDYEGSNAGDSPSNSGD